MIKIRTGKRRLEHAVTVFFPSGASQNGFRVFSVFGACAFTQNLKGFAEILGRLDQRVSSF